MTQRPLMLLILDGWGWRVDAKANAVLQARTPCFDELWKNYPHTFLRTCGEDVGLPSGTMGNSEVGHLNLGAGRVVYQDLSRINRSIQDGSFFRNPTLLKVFEQVKQSGGKLHLMGLGSDVGVHSHLKHLDAMLEAAASAALPRVFVHLFSDGRDAPPTAGKAYAARVEKKCTEVGNAKLATICGRYYAMDRDKRWERTQKAWDALVLGKGELATSSAELFDKNYAAGVTDEFILPTVLDADGLIADHDAVIFFNFRSDRARQITRAFTELGFSGFSRSSVPKLSTYVCMTEYEASFNLPILFPVENLKNTLGEVLAKHGLKQLRAAETEKYAHVTFFFNGGEEKASPGEERLLIQSPRDVATYDLKPEMSAEELTQAVLQKIAEQKHDMFILNFANPDMVGHTGSLPAAIKAVEKVDDCMKRIVAALLAKNGELLITADHGNCEQMQDEHGNPLTSHTLNVVPCLFVSARAAKARFVQEGRLCDVAPTLLHALALPQPAEMTGVNLLEFYA